MALAWEFDEFGDDGDADWLAALMASTVTDVAPPSLLERLEAMRPRWHALAACRGSGVDFFNSDQAAAAEALCGRCPVAFQCRAAGRREATGIWAGEAHGVEPPPPPVKPPPVEPKPERPAVCVECGADEVKALGLCTLHYRRLCRRRAGAAERPVGRTLAACVECRRVGPVTRGLCGACYSRLRRDHMGTT